MNMEDIHYNKYIKYKTKYLELKEQSAGVFEGILYTPCKIAPRKSNNLSHKSSVNIITEIKDEKSEIFNSQEDAIERNDKQKKHINNIYVPLIELLTNLKDTHKFKKFESIIDKLKKSNNRYLDYDTQINTQINGLDNQLNIIRDEIKVNERTINKEIDTIKFYNFNINFNSTINTEINKITNLNHIFGNKNKNEGICSLQYIITCYFDKIIDGLECLISVQHFNK